MPKLDSSRSFYNRTHAATLLIGVKFTKFSCLETHDPKHLGPNEKSNCGALDDKDTSSAGLFLSSFFMTNVPFEHSPHRHLQ